MADVRKLSEFYNNLVQNGVQFKNHFQITIEPISDKFGDNNRFTFHAQGGPIPAATLNPAPLQFFGMTFNLPNNLTFSGSWSTEVVCDAELKIRDIVDEWMDEFADLKKSGGGNKKIPAYKAYIDVLDMTLEKITKSYVMVGIWPTSPGEITLSHTDTGVATFTLGIQYQYFYPEDKGDPLGEASGPGRA
ncbi:MAG TPA: hypothetical protein PLA71_00635 [Saccharofermentans sp.]|nr:hypothetical protein [Saccharofermentans sp.]